MLVLPDGGALLAVDAVVDLLERLERRRIRHKDRHARQPHRPAEVFDVGRDVVRHAQPARRAVEAPKRRLPRLDGQHRSIAPLPIPRRAGICDGPLQLRAGGRGPAAGDGIGVHDTGGAGPDPVLDLGELLSGPGERQGPVDDATLWPGAPAVLGALGPVDALGEGDQLEVDAVGEQDELVLGRAAGVHAARDDGEVVREPGGEVVQHSGWDEDDYVVQEREGRVRLVRGRGGWVSHLGEATLGKDV
ncbi:hypothetical protein ACKVWC_011580 [Pyricularia oryzae]